MESEGDHFLAYYLPKEDDAALQFKGRRRNAADALEAEEVSIMHHLTENSSHHLFLPVHF